MAYDFSDLKKKIEDSQNWLKAEFQNIRTGQASIAILDPVRVDAYGVLSPVNQVAAIGIEDPRTIKVTPWDKSLAAAVEKAIVSANLGVGVVADSSGIRVTVPELTGERRTELTKLAKAKLEEARVAVRQARDDVWNDIQKVEREGDMTEDEKFKTKEEMEKVVKEGNSALEALYSKKEEDLSL